ncbi:hypothetical protein M9R32_12460 [Paenisporosarcina quisquiliarum]|uniref:YhfM-like domain-containing protein n=1 Tax=Paenisporosarcina quisquiliarum TaxID=365346 RepID=A0A9X3LIH3_9BACL|nr:hypothetical protein [Paenisporosarcina quisquiliarum]MCZ8538000.1 hypothetical protein [Paenisporosarcina quisquiliarum]
MNVNKMLFLGVLILFLLVSCGDVQEQVEQINLQYWDDHKETVIYRNDEDTMDTFIQAVENAKKMEKQKIIKTEPLLSFYMQKDDRVENYHLWINTDKEGFIQQLHPQRNETFRLDESAIEKLASFLIEKENIELIEKQIEFE